MLPFLNQFENAGEDTSRLQKERLPVAKKSG
jgi:hypothetical protein